MAKQKVSKTNRGGIAMLTVGRMNLARLFSKVLLTACALALAMTACGQADPYTGPDGPVTTEGLTLSWSSDGEWILFPSSSGGSPPELYALNVADTLDGAGREEWLHLSQGFTDVIEPADPNAGTYMHLAWSLDG